MIKGREAALQGLAGGGIEPLFIQVQVPAEDAGGAATAAS